MPFSRPTLTTLRTQAMQDITSSDLPNADGYLRRAVLRVLAWVQAGMAHLHYGYLDWISKQSVPFTCTDEFLAGWAALKNVTREPATAATGTWAGTGTGGDGTPLPYGTILQRSDGFQYVTTAPAALSSGAITAPIIAATTGSAGNADSGTPLSLATVIAGINSTGAASGPITGGADQETDAHLRTRMLAAYQAPPQGGAATDYVEWALNVPGVTRAWCNPLEYGDGTVAVYTMFDVTEALNNGFPVGTNGVATLETRSTVIATGDQLTVANALFPLRPVTAEVWSKAPTASPLNFTIAGLNPSNTTTKAAATSAITGVLFEKASPLANVSIDQSDVDAAISAQPGIISFRTTAPSFPQTPTVGAIFTLGTITFA